MARQSTSLIDTFENDNEAFEVEALTIHYVQKQIDYHYSIN